MFVESQFSHNQDTLSLSDAQPHANCEYSYIARGLTPENCIKSIVIKCLSELAPEPPIVNGAEPLAVPLIAQVPILYP